VTGHERTRLSFTLVGDGPSDRLLAIPTRWLLRRHGVGVDRASWADFARLGVRPASLRERVRAAVDLYPADLLVVHRDAEGEPPENRREEIRRAVEGVPCLVASAIPVRMLEAWLLHDERAIRMASGNPNGSVTLSVPKVSALERVTDPKETLRAALLDSAEASGRRLRKKQQEFGEMRALTAERIETFEPLLALPAFAAFDQSIAAAVAQWRAPRAG